MLFFGILFIVSTTLVLFFKKEEAEAPQILHDSNSQDESQEEEFSVKETYFQMWKIIWLMPVKKLILILLTVKVIIPFRIITSIK